MLLLLLLLNKLQVKLPCWSPFIGKYMSVCLSVCLSSWLVVSPFPYVALSDSHNDTLVVQWFHGFMVSFVIKARYVCAYKQLLDISSVLDSKYRLRGKSMGCMQIK